MYTPFNLPSGRRLCYISRNYNSLNMARINTETLLQKWGAVSIGRRQTRYKSKAAGFLHNLLGVLLYTLRIRKGDIVVLQYPVKKWWKWLCRVARWRGATTVTLIHDLGCMRRQRITVEEELRRLRLTDYIIATNSVMLAWCREKGLTHAQGALELWDYPSPEPLRLQPALTTQHPAPDNLPIVVYTARLDTRRNAFFTLLEKMDLDYELHLYGQKVGASYGDDNPHITSFPHVPSDIFIRTVRADYGLVWYGHSLDSLTGRWGEYTKICTPMKVSFYLRAGMPCIIPRGAALAPLVEREGIGIVLDDLRTLGERIASLTREERQTMMQNVQRMQQRINDGYYLRQALERALQTITA